MTKYRGFVRPNKRMALVVEDLTLSGAVEFLEDHSDGVILDENNKELTQEDLTNVKSFRSLPGIGEDSFTTRRSTVSKDSDRKLSVFNRDNTESSTERDNKRDKQS